MNAGMFAQMLGMNQEKTARLSSAWEQAQRASQGVNSLEQAKKVINTLGMTNDAILQAGKLLDSPLAGIVASAFGADIGKAKKALSQLTGHSVASKSQGDSLAKLRQGLQQLKG